MNDNSNANNNCNTSSREDPNKNASERTSPPEEPPVTNRINQFDGNKLSVCSLESEDIDTILSAIDCEKDVTICNGIGWNVMHYAAGNDWFNVVEAIVNKPYCHNLINSLTNYKESPLVVASRRSSKNIAEYLLKVGANFGLTDIFGKTVLHYASEKGGWLDIVQELVKKGIDIDALTSLHETALIIAAKHSNEKVVSFLIDANANCNYCDRDGWGILHFAVKYGWLKTVVAVANNVVDINAKTKESDTALLLAVKSKNINIVNALMDLGANVHCCDSKGWSLVHYASSYGLFDIVVAAIKKGVDLDSETNKCETPLLLAARENYKVLVKFFIDLGVNLKCTDDFKRNILHWSSMNGWTDIAEYAVKTGIDPNAESLEGTPLKLAFVHENKDVASFLMDAGADVHFMGLDNWTILHYAAACGWCDLAHRVINQVDINAKTTKPRTVLELACVLSQKEFVIYLINAGADIHFTASHKTTVLHFAAQYGWLEVVQYAIEKGVHINALSEKHETALLVAARNCHLEIVQLLILLGADVNLANHYGTTVLHYAAEIGWLEVTKSVIKNGCNVNAMNNSCNTPLHVACMFTEIAVLKCLIEAGADMNAKVPRLGYTPLNYACGKKCVSNREANVNVVKLLIENGVFPEKDDCLFLAKASWLKEGILGDEKLCVQALVNKYNSQDLPKLYRLPFSNELPSISNFKYGKGSMVLNEIERHVKQIIDTKGYCDLWQLYNQHPRNLSMLSLRSLLLAFRHLIL